MIAHTSTISMTFPSVTFLDYQFGARDSPWNSHEFTEREWSTSVMAGGTYKLRIFHSSAVTGHRNFRSGVKIAADVIDIYIYIG